MDYFIQQNIPISLERSKRARHLRVIVFRNGEVKVVAPLSIPDKKVDQFLNEKHQWITRTRERFLKKPLTEIGLLLAKRSVKEYRAYKSGALKVITERLNHFNNHYRFTFGRVTIKNQSSRWGSCSKSGNLNFNYKLLFLPPELRDYVVVHELCHLKEHNHGPRFWKLVSEVVSDYKDMRKRLRGVK